jgi:hypothetical protein
VQEQHRRPARRSEVGVAQAESPPSICLKGPKDVCDPGVTAGILPGVRSIAGALGRSDPGDRAGSEAEGSSCYKLAPRNGDLHAHRTSSGYRRLRRFLRPDSSVADVGGERRLCAWVKLARLRVHHRELVCSEIADQWPVGLLAPGSRRPSPSPGRGASPPSARRPCPHSRFAGKRARCPQHQWAAINSALADNTRTAAQYARHCCSTPEVE